MAPQARLPHNEEARLKILQEFNVLDSLPEADYDAIVGLAAKLCDVPIAVISLVDSERQWFKAITGLDVQETPRDAAFCAHAILDPTEIFEVEDATQDKRFADNPLVIEDPKIRFYAGYPLATQSGEGLGTLCLIDQKPKKLTDDQLETLKYLGKITMKLLETRKIHYELEQRQGLLELAEEISGIGHWWIDVKHNLLFWSEGTYRIHGLTPDAYSPSVDTAVSFYHPDDQQMVTDMVKTAMRDKEPFGFKARLQRLDGQIRDVQSKCQCKTDAEGNLIEIFGVFQDITQEENVAD